MYRLPVLIVDSGTPALSSTNTLSIRVCDCDSDGTPQSCGTEAFMLSAGLSTGALVAILACIITLLGRRSIFSPHNTVVNMSVETSFVTGFLDFGFVHLLWLLNVLEMHSVCQF